MRDRTQFWIQLITSIIAPLVLGSGGVAALVIFREDLPEWLYSGFIFILCLFCICVLIRIAFGDLIQRFRTWTKNRLYRRKIYRLVKNWCAKWLEMASLVHEVIDANGQPTKEQHERYFALHFWFINNRTRVIPLWHHFWNMRPSQAYEKYSQGEEREVFHDNHADPFSCFYEPMMLEMLKDRINSRHWRKEHISFILSKLSELTFEFVQWARSHS